MSSMDPTELTSQPDDVTECPYKQKQFVLREEEENKKVGILLILYSFALPI